MGCESSHRRPPTSQLHIERADNLPVILTWLLKMQVHTIIDTIWPTHGNWQGLSFGQLAVLFLTYVIQRRTHNLSKMEAWLVQHHTVLEHLTGWSLGPKEATDDRLGILLETLGAQEAAGYEMQRQLSQRQIQAFALPTQVARYDTTSFSVHHAPAQPGEEPHAWLRFGYSKDHRPDLLQFKQGLGTLDPAGVPLFTQTLSGEVADDGLYVRAWQEMRRTIGHPVFLFVADCKAASQETRASIAAGQGRYLFPLPLTGHTPRWLAEQVQQHTAQPIVFPHVRDPQGHPKRYGQGFVVERQQCSKARDGAPQPPYEWTEQCFITRSEAHAKRQQQALEERLRRTEQTLQRLRPQPQESAAAFAGRAQQVLEAQQTTECFSLSVQEEVREQKRYLRRGRPTAQTPCEIITDSQLALRVQRQPQAIEQAQQRAGWRVYVSNTTAAQMSLTQAMVYYREEWQVEHGVHRFKQGSLPALPLAVRLPERIRGLMLLLFVALQALTLLEFVSRRSLAQQQTTIAGLFPGNPQRQTERPSAEQLLAAFDHLHLIVVQEEGDEPPTTRRCSLHEPLSPLQLQILDLLQLSPNIYQFGQVPAPP
jgi:transposase